VFIPARGVWPCCVNGEIVPAGFIRSAKILPLAGVPLKEGRGFAAALTVGNPSVCCGVDDVCGWAATAVVVGLFEVSKLNKALLGAKLIIIK
jgi:hypothetical protein